MTLIACDLPFALVPRRARMGHVSISARAAGIIAMPGWMGATALTKCCELRGPAWGYPMSCRTHAAGIRTLYPFLVDALLLWLRLLFM